MERITMNIIYARMPGYEWISVPSDAVARELKNLGHNIIIVEQIYDVPVGNYDFVWSPYESVTLLGDAISRKLKIPHASHIEVLPPWRIFENIDYKNYGLTKDDPELTDIKNTRPYYLKVGKAWYNSDIPTLSSKTRIQMHEFLGDMSKIQLRYPSIDTYTINKIKQLYKPERIQNRVLTVSRATFIKRYDLLVNVMNKINTDMEWAIVGAGPALEMIKQKLINPKVKLLILGPMFGWQRYLEMMKSSYFLYAMGGMPPLEAALLGSFPCGIEQEPTQHIPDFDKFLEDNFGDSIPLFKYNESEKAAEFMDFCFKQTPDELLNKWDTVNKFWTGKTNVRPAKENAQQIIDRFCKLA